MVAGTAAGMAAGAVAAAVLAAGGTPIDGTGPGPDPGPGPARMRVEARFAPPTAFVPSAAVTYDMDLVPAGSWIQVTQTGPPRPEPSEAGRSGGAKVANTTTVTLRVNGMKPGHAYGVHVHQKPCGAAPEDAGGHYQHRVDPVQPSKDPDYVNPRNEVWLDFTAGPDGSGEARARHRWGFRPGEARSVVLHDAPGGAGDRAACFTVPFEPRGEAREGD
ncbi:superoxide dismutase family protein [Streptomyces sp. NPDC048518]|uniref:superoxide dismutase family protein n=1 Tax=Streptomyces sp. NPDC048518 TaxID=3155029 RepID=UPI0033D8B328